MTNIEIMKAYIVENNLQHLVRELNEDGQSTNECIEYVYDGHTMSKEDFIKKYF